MKSNSLGKNTIFNVIYNISNIIFPLITSMYVSRILLSDGIGQIAYGQNIASYFVTFAALGLPTYGIREIAKVRKNSEMTNHLFTELFIINSVSTCISSVAYLVIIFSVDSFRNNYLLFLCCGLKIFINFINIDWFYQGSEEYVYIACRSIIVKLFSLIAVVLCVHSHNDYIIYALISTLGNCINYLFNIIHVKKYVKLELKNCKFKRHFKPLIILAFSIFLSSAYSKVDITMLGIISEKSAVGIYNNAHKIVEMVITICTSISAVFLPKLSYYYQNNQQQFYKLLKFGIKILSLLTFPMTAGIFILAPQFIQLMYGNSFISGSTTIRIFSLLIIIKSFGDLLCYQLVIATGNEKQRLPAYFFAAVINIVLNSLLIQYMQQDGAAIASVVSEFVVNGYQMISMAKIIKISFSIRAILQGIITTFIMSVFVYGIIKILTGCLIQCIAGVLVGAVVYGTANIIIKNEICIEGLKIIKKKLNNLL